jgi:proprotein convertase subtilisin/kexin type 5
MNTSASITTCKARCLECRSMMFSFSCRWCDSRCSTCSGPEASQCLTCDRTSKYPNLQMTACVGSCSPGFYLGSGLGQCLPCFDTCLNCTSSSDTACSSCKLGYMYMADEHRCEKYTGKPFYRDPKTGEDRPCHPSCTMCTGPKPTDCIGCNTITEVLLDDGHCVNECPAGSFVNTSKGESVDANFCSPCSTGCEKCVNHQHCLQCSASAGYTLKGVDCLPTCAAGYVDHRHL